MNDAFACWQREIGAVKLAHAIEGTGNKKLVHITLHYKLLGWISEGLTAL